MVQGGYRGKNYMEKNSKPKFDYLFLEKSTLLLLRIVLFVSLLIIAFKNINNWWALSLTVGVMLILVMFRRLDFFEVNKVLKAGVIDYNNRNKTASGASTTPDDIIRDLKINGPGKTIKSDFPKEEIIKK
jgi:hypothetical protein